MEVMEIAYIPIHLLILHEKYNLFGTVIFEILNFSQRKLTALYHRISRVSTVMVKHILVLNAIYRAVAFK